MKLVSALFLLVSLVVSPVWATALTPQQKEKIEKVTHGYEFAKKSLDQFLKGHASARENEFLRKLRDCEVRNVGDGEGKLVEGPWVKCV